MKAADRQVWKIEGKAAKLIIDDICFLSYLYIYFMAEWDLCAEV
jgi:hypothetical protein